MLAWVGRLLPNSNKGRQHHSTTCYWYFQCLPFLRFFLGHHMQRFHFWDLSFGHRQTDWSNVPSWQRNSNFKKQPGRMLSPPLSGTGCFNMTPSQIHNEKLFWLTNPIWKIRCEWRCASCNWQDRTLVLLGRARHQSRHSMHNTASWATSNKRKLATTAVERLPANKNIQNSNRLQTNYRISQH